MVTKTHLTNNSQSVMKTQEFNENNLVDYLFVASKEHLYSEMQVEGVILSLTNGKYYGVNEVGATIWSAIQAPASFNKIQTAVMDNYYVDSETCRLQILEFLQVMFKEDLIEILHEKAV